MAGRTIGFLVAIWLIFSHLPAGAEEREPWIVAHRGLRAEYSRNDFLGAVDLKELREVLRQAVQ